MLNKVLLNWCIPKNYLAHSKEVTTKFINQRSGSDWNSIISSALFENKLAFFYIFYALLMETNVNRLQCKYTNIIYRKYSY